jgi:two-component system, NarL family, response regulator LiaR
VHFPQVRILILTAYDDEPYVLMLLRAGIDGYLLKTAQSSDLVRAVKQVAAGQTVMDPSLTRLLIATLADTRQLEPLSERELAVVRGVARGWSNREIGRALVISERTVQGHLANVFGKLQANSRTEVVTVALQQGLIHLDETTTEPDRVSTR